MGVFDAVKTRIGSNLKFVQLSYMTHPADIIQFCRSLAPDDRVVVLKGIESSFKWQPAAQLAQTLFPALCHSGGGVSQEAKDMALGGDVSAAVRMMSWENQAPPTPQFGMTATQQATLSFAWVVLKALEQEDSGAPASVAVCRACGERRRSADPFCAHCGRRF